MRNLNTGYTLPSSDTAENLKIFPVVRGED